MILNLAWYHFISPLHTGGCHSTRTTCIYFCRHWGVSFYSILFIENSRLQFSVTLRFLGSVLNTYLMENDTFCNSGQSASSHSVFYIFKLAPSGMQGEGQCLGCITVIHSRFYCRFIIYACASTKILSVLDPVHNSGIYFCTGAFTIS
jgi:hypothetical protein